MISCCRCGKEIPYEQTGVDFLFFRTDKDMDEDEKSAYVVPMSKDYNDLKFVKNFVAPTLCYDCCKELEDYLVDFIGEKE